MSYPAFPWGKITFTTVTFLGLGYALMKTTVPTEEELYNRMAPDIQRKVDIARAARIARENETKQQVMAQSQAGVDPDLQKPVWADTPKK